ncbi:glycoside hydrolase family 24 [Alsobacter metallidurans]|uniref:Glycoside hydrolase family 24 n=1 Tax=Alsobacter metallidurans TaxID=340221 RepID=A0A917I5Z3_9HYPH|nr:DUF2460 domain-containing protein [Alsobacter metallidurans]GGH13933.1 glycoside hydrolase family 24 [Alsobacter metallidurans]
MPAPFHEVRFPVDVAVKSRGGPRRRTDVVVTGSGREERNARWAHARRRYDAGYGVKTLTALAAVVAFFEERRGRLYGFRWRDRLDDRSCTPGAAPGPLDMPIGTGAAGLASFALAKTYGAAFAPYRRPIEKPVAGSVRVAVAGVERAAGVDWDVDAATGQVTFRPGKLPAPGAAVTAGFLFDVPVRFDADELIVDLAAFEAGEIPSIPLIEIIP